jgi:hypothetical protein
LPTWRPARVNPAVLGHKMSVQPGLGWPNRMILQDVVLGEIVSWSTDSWWAEHPTGQMVRAVLVRTDAGWCGCGGCSSIHGGSITSHNRIALPQDTISDDTGRSQTLVLKSVRTTPSSR